MTTFGCQSKVEVRNNFGDQPITFEKENGWIKILDVIHNNFFFNYWCSFLKHKALLRTADAFSADNLDFVCFLNNQPNPAKPSLVEPV